MPRNKDRKHRRRLQHGKGLMNCGTWNVQSCTGKMQDILKSVEHAKLDIITLTETKRKGSGIEETGNYLHIYSGVEKSERASKGVSILIHKKYKSKISNWEAISDRIVTLNLTHLGHQMTIIGVYAPTDDTCPTIKDEHEETLNEVLNELGGKREIILMGDMNGRTGRKFGNLVVGGFGENTRNNNGDRLINMCEQHGLKILNGFFQHKDIHKFTWREDTRQLRSIIDYIIIRQETELRVEDVRVHRGMECGSDHYLVKAKIKVSYKNREHRRSNTLPDEEIEPALYNVDSLNYENIKNLYKWRLDKALDEGCSNGPNEDPYSNIVKSIRKAAEEALGTTQQRKRKVIDWWSEELENQKIVKQKAFNNWLNTKSPSDKHNYCIEQKKFKKLATKGKDEMWEKKCTEINTFMGGTKSSEAWKFIRNLRSDSNQQKNPPMISLQRWQQHYQQELTERRVPYMIPSPTPYRLKGTEILITPEMVIKAAKSIKNGKASGPENIPPELLKYGSIKLMNMLAELFTRYANGTKIPEIWNQAWITPIHKKGRKDQCDNYRCISVTSSMSRLYGKVIKTIIEEEYSPYELEEQGGFRAGRSCVDHIFTLTQIIEKKMATNRETYLMFVDLTKAYDNVPVKKLWEVMGKTSINITAINAVKQFYQNPVSRVKIGRTLSKSFAVTKGLRQGCCISPTLFKIFLDQALHRWRKKCHGMGIPITDQSSVYTLHFADDQVVIAHDKEDLEYMTRKLLEEYAEWGLIVNMNKTRYMSVGGEVEDLTLNDGTIIKGCEEYLYLGTKITNTGRCENEITDRVGKAKRVIGALNSVLWSKSVHRERKKDIYNAIFKSITLYGCEVWQLNQTQENKLLATEMDFWRRSAGISRMDHIRNERVRDIMQVERNIIQDIQQRQLCWYGHVERMDDTRIPKQVSKWTPTEKRKRGRPKASWMGGIKKAMSQLNLRPGDWTDRDRWRLGTGGRRRTL